MAGNMVLVLDGNSDHVPHVCRKNRPFFVNNVKFGTDADLHLCIKHIILPLLTCASISELPYISAMA